MSHDSFKKQIIALLRESAQLIEEGLITDYSVDIEFGWDMVRKPNGLLEHVSNGRKKAMITINAGVLCRDRMQSWIEDSSKKE
jgi:hypothetical protein